MRGQRIRRIGVLGAALALVLTACGGDDEGGAVAKVEEKPAFAAGSTMAKLNADKSIKIGVKYDQPNVGFKKPGTDTPEGFDIEIAKIIAAKLGIEPKNIKWTETISKNREPYIKGGNVDIVVASYSITDKRRAEVGQAGPYYVTGQQLLVRKDDASINGPEQLKGKKVCSVTGSTSIATVEEKYGATPVPFGTYSECVQQLLSNAVDAVTTDGAILLGYAADNADKLKVVGQPFSEERYGIGYKKGDQAFCEFLNKTLQDAIANGEWKKAWEKTLSDSGAKAPEPPTVDPCES